MRYEPGLLASVTLSDVLGVSVTARSSAATFWFRSDGCTTSTPLTVTVAEETRLEPSASPFWTCREYGAANVAGTVIVSV